MTAATEIPEDVLGKKSKIPLVLGLIFALVGGGGAFYAIYSGMLFSESQGHEKAEEKETVVPFLDVAFVPVDPIIVSLGPTASSRHLRFRSQLEVDPKYESDVNKLMPRIVDVLNNYLRALQARDIEQPAALILLRAQMLRRIQIVVGPGRVNDLLVMEFVLN